ncbi:MAG TPA: toll/interleukin-1 receptor domain-containing protein, partial [Longimicrobium sp.]|nr:toll/interleukin-1 receptor domain-containing protein [Longimicrobium sp.]
MTNSSSWTRALDEFIEYVRREFGDEAADELRASAGAFRSEVRASDRLSGIGEMSRKEARRAFERAVDQAAKRLGDDPLARRVRKDGKLKDLLADWLFEEYLAEIGDGPHAAARSARREVRPDPREPLSFDREVRTHGGGMAFGPEKNDFRGGEPAREADSPAALEWEEAAPDLDPPPPSSASASRSPSPPTPPESSAPEPRTAAPAPRPEPVFMDACAPKSVRPGDRFSAELSAYVRAFEAEAREAMENLDDPGSEAQRGVKAGRWATDAPVTVRLVAPDLAVEKPERDFVWDGEYQTLDFRVSVPADAPSRRTTLTFEVIVAGFATELTLDIEIGAAASAEMARAEARSPRSAFVSYSHKDLDEVFRRVASMSAFNGAEFFVDRDGLVMSEHWSEGLRRAILEKEVFLLFWSRNAEASKEVRKEWEFALERKGLKAMQVHLLELVDVKTMPTPFNQLHLDST